MPHKYLLEQGTRQTPQSARMRADQVANSAGGFAWAVDEWTRLRRFLILGSEGGSYYASERDLTTENVQAIKDCVAADGLRAVNEIVTVSHDGRAPKNDPALYALAYAISKGDKATKSAAAEALPKVARIGTHLYHFVAYAETMRGWGRTMRWAVSNWYEKNPQQLALQAIKYRSRDGWSHRDLLRLAHPKNSGNAPLFDWIAHGEAPSDDFADGGLISAFQQAQESESPATTASLVREYRLPREALKSEHLTDVGVWHAMLEQRMPLHAMIRNLANMTRTGVLDSKDHNKLVLDTLTDQEAIRRSRLHPIAVLMALQTYNAGRGLRGTNTWNPRRDVIDALNDSFYLAFKNVEPTGGSTLLALDVSGSMAGDNVAGVPGLTPRDASAAMALVTANVETDYEIVGFFTGGSSRAGWASTQRSRYQAWSSRDGLTPLTISPKQRLNDAINVVSNLPFGGTDCALPMIYAAANGLKFDNFIVYTDSETWAGSIHPSQALQMYREQFVPTAKLAVVGMVSNGFSIADPNGAGMMDVVGFDSAAPGLISDFARGSIG